MIAKEVWNMFTCGAGVDDGKSYEIRSNQYFIKNQGEMRRNIYALRVTEEMFGDREKGIVEVMLKQVKSWKSRYQLSQIGKEYPQEIEDNKRYT